MKSRDFQILFSTRTLRLFAYGFLSVVLALYLAQVGLTGAQIGLLLTFTLLGDTAISLWITTHADRIGRRKMLIAGSILMVAAGVVFAFSHSFLPLLIAATIGVISPSGLEVGPFLSIEQAGLSQIIDSRRRTQTFAWYNLAGSFATALGALSGGWLAQILQARGVAPLGSYRVIVIGYAMIGIILGLIFTFLSPAVEVPKDPIPADKASPARKLLGLHRSWKIVAKLSALFSLDAFAGGLVLQSIIAYWFHVRFKASPALLGDIFFGANILAGLSALSAAKIASKIGLIRTMVFTHIPTNIFLILVPLMPNLPLAIAVLLLRFSISQMDVPTRQSYTMAVVDPDERSSAAGITGIARTTGSSLSPVLAGTFLGQQALLGLPFFLSGGLKIVYDLLLYRNFRNLKPPQEAEAAENSR